MRTPWGTADGIEEIAPGIVFYSTPSHGGYKVSADLNKRIPEIFRRSAMIYAPSGWYEEDCAYAMVHAFLPEYFSDKEVAAAWNTLKRWYPKECEMHLTCI